MSMRIFSATSATITALMLLSGCGLSSEENKAVTTNVANNGNSADAVAQRNKAAEEGKPACAIGDDKEFKSICTLERSSDNEGVILTLRQPEGGFHRLRIVKDGRGVIAADGSEQPKVSVVGDHEIEVAFANVRYRLPANGKAKKPPAS